MLDDIAGHYSAMDRLLYQAAFRGLDAQSDFSKLEDRLFASRLSQIQIGEPVFITSLPRAGTTLLLELIVATNQFASHTYRDLPFLLCPLLWDSASGRFRRRTTSRPRAHGDGMEISYDSPEAFEEIIWRFFFPGHYRDERIDVWRQNEASREFSSFFVDHMRKILFLRLKGKAGRYASKNNANIARLSLLRSAFPKCSIVVPFREPLSQARSLLNQHLRFLELHARSPFAQKYMNWIGHLEFGANLRPIAFEGFDFTDIEQARTLDYWLVYWVAGFEHILAQNAKPVLLSYDRLCERPEAVLGSLANELGIPQGSLAHGSIRPTPAATGGPALPEADPVLVRRANAVHESLQAQSVGLAGIP